mmetsp:Transcript_559/g.1455  ORF Transcript_559/g.1455 Transcript_559/m.1455 type:complete len:213 (+) Transcript_559:119-757(+)
MWRRPPCACWAFAARGMPGLARSGLQVDAFAPSRSIHHLAITKVISCISRHLGFGTRPRSRRCSRRGWWEVATDAHQRQRQEARALVRASLRRVAHRVAHRTAQPWPWHVIESSRARCLPIDDGLERRADERVERIERDHPRLDCLKQPRAVGVHRARRAVHIKVVWVELVAVDAAQVDAIDVAAHLQEDEELSHAPEPAEVAGSTEEQKGL